jgi:nucleoid DNA-binding protein
MAKKVASKPAETRNTPAPAAKPAPKAAAARPKPATKREIHAALAEKAGVGQEQGAGVFAALGELIGRELGKKGPGKFVIPGLLKLKVASQPATKAKPGRNPFTGEAITIKAKPARNVVRVVPMKALKEMA